jgi:hypothetical protein
VTNLALAGNAANSLDTGKGSAVNSTSRGASTALLEVGLEKDGEGSALRVLVLADGRSNGQQQQVGAQTHGGVNALEASLETRDGAGGVGSGAESGAAGEGAASASGRGDGRDNADVVGAGKAVTAELSNKYERSVPRPLRDTMRDGAGERRRLTKSGSDEQSSPSAPWVSQF